MVACATYPECGTSFGEESSDEKRTFPADGFTKHAAILSKVVFPEPFRPARTTHSRAAIFKETRRNGYNPPYRLSIFSKWIPAGAIFSGKVDSINETPLL